LFKKKSHQTCKLWRKVVTCNISKMLTTA